MPALFALIAAALLWLARRQAGARRNRAQTVIVSAPRSTLIADDGAVRSVQSARLQLERADLERLWSAENLENLGATYWHFLNRVTLGVIRVVYGPEERRVVFLVRALTLLRFAPPDYQLEPARGRISWRIKDGLLVARRGRDKGWLSLTVRRADQTPSELEIDVEVANFYPAIASWLGTFFYEVTQSFVHVLVTHAFLRSLATLELEQSKVADLAPLPGG
ncbi:MAG: hypothetical protein J2O48_05270 [Solirubrobacterales bacterium]|nr:hypothetical protein [Solirubrobacterales bacterium]